ncbi:aldose 1-epimerase [Clostridium sp.]|uniref:aldose 1-epimerase n=1 Tax=Clostridium sp. TaxID=1506 RepID=UPI002623BB1C|nr:aldose 1-epimerase [uncultured Clostridium sp.]
MGSKTYNSTKIEITKWKGHKAIAFSAGGYEALLIPEVGANVIMLKDNNRGLNILRTPGEEVTFEEFKERPQIYGIPILFPPNRIEDGRFKVKNKQYEFPINEPEKNNHIHGFLRNVNWDIDELEVIDSNRVHVKVKFQNDESSGFYKYFPNRFSTFLTYELSCKGLQQKLEIFNLGYEDLPVGVGFHTAINIPFYLESKPKDYFLKASIGEKWELNKRSLPTGKRILLNKEEKKIRKEGLNPLKEEMDGHYTVESLNIEDKNFKGFIIEDRNSKTKVIYEIGEKYKHMMIWNSNGDKNFVCTEPQSWVINAPNVRLNNNITGFNLLKFGEKWSEICTIYSEDLDK